MYGRRGCIASALAAALLQPVTPAGAASGPAAQFVAERTTTGAARLRVDVTTVTDGDDGVLAFVALARDARGALRATDPHGLRGGGAGPAAYALGANAECGRVCAVLVTGTASHASVDMRDEGGASRYVALLVGAVGGSTSLRVHEARGWRVRRVPPRFSVSDARAGRAIGARAGAVGGEVLVRSDVTVDHARAVAVARAPCGRGVGDAAGGGVLSNGDRRAGVACDAGGTAALAGAGSPRWTLQGPAGGAGEAASARVVFAL